MESSDFSKIALLFKALADPNRLKILFCLASSTKKSLTVSEIVKFLKISQPLTSHHLKELRYAGIVATQRNGPFIHYKLVSGEILRLIECAFLFVEEISEEQTEGSRKILTILNSQKPFNGEETPHG